jgi:hypothetical protein
MMFPSNSSGRDRETATPSRHSRPVRNRNWESAPGAVGRSSQKAWGPNSRVAGTPGSRSLSGSEPATGRQAARPPMRSPIRSKPRTDNALHCARRGALRRANSTPICVAYLTARGAKKARVQPGRAQSSASVLLPPLAERVAYVRFECARQSLNAIHPSPVGRARRELVRVQNIFLPRAKRGGGGWRAQRDSRRGHRTASLRPPPPLPPSPRLRRTKCRLTTRRSFSVGGSRSPPPRFARGRNSGAEREPLCGRALRLYPPPRQTSRNWAVPT